MSRLSVAPALAASAFLLALAACDDQPNGPNAVDLNRAAKGDDRGAVSGALVAANLVAANPKVLAEITNPASGEKVTVYNGGYGSAIATDPWRRDVFYLMTDRGPNYDYNGGIAFAVPDFHPQIGVFKRVGQQLVRTDVVTLKNNRCKPLTGLPIPAGAGGSTGEIAYRADGSILTPDPDGLDSEGLVAMWDGSFWVSDEYGPFLAHFDARGCTIERVGPFGANRALPKVLGKRRPNRGMEGLTAVLGGRVLVGAMQSPLDNPKAAGRASRLTRLVLFDTRTGKTRQYAYLLESCALATREILALGPRRFLVLERDGEFPGANAAAVKKLYEIDLRGATDIGDPANGETGLLVGGQTLEELTANAADPAAVLAAAGITPVKKTLAVDILAEVPGYPHDKVEGLTLVDRQTVAVSNDDDFAVAAGVGGLVQKVLPGFTPARPDFNEVVFVKLPRGMRADDVGNDRGEWR